MRQMHSTTKAEGRRDRREGQRGDGSGKIAAGARPGPPRVGRPSICTGSQPVLSATPPPSFLSPTVLRGRNCRIAVRPPRLRAATKAGGTAGQQPAPATCFPGLGCDPRPRRAEALVRDRLPTEAGPGRGAGRGAATRPQGEARSLSEEQPVQIKDTAFHCAHTHLPFCDRGCCGFGASHLIRKSWQFRRKSEVFVETGFRL